MCENHCRPEFEAEVQYCVPGHTGDSGRSGDSGDSGLPETSAQQETVLETLDDESDSDRHAIDDDDNSTKNQ